MKIINGDLVQMALGGEFDAIFHGCNCFHTMGSGIAKQIRAAFPEAYEADLTTQHADVNKLGTVSIAESDDGLAIVNCYTQYKYGTNQKHFVESALQLILDKMSITVNEFKPTDRLHYGFPLIGCGLAGGDGNVVVSMLQKFSEQVKDYVDVTLVLYTE